MKDKEKKKTNELKRCYEKPLFPAKVHLEVYSDVLSEEEIKSREEYLKDLIDRTSKMEFPFPFNISDDEVDLSWYLLDNVGQIVGSEIHGLTTWDGETKKWYITTDVDPKTIPITDDLRNHITKISESRFEGSFWIVAFKP